VKKYVILAGVNGAGKSTLYSLVPKFAEYIKINLDDEVRQVGDWRNVSDVYKASKIILAKLRDAFENGQSLCQETTLCGKTIIRSIERAKEEGYVIELHYVGLNSADLAKDRVANRVKHGGHGISDEDIERRYVESKQNLKYIIPKCDLAVIYDNTDSFRRFALYKRGELIRISSRVPDWYN